MRKWFRGTLTIDRPNWNDSSYLEAKVRTPEGLRFMYAPAPRGLYFATSGLNLTIPIAFRANEDGSNPRAVKDLRCPWNDKYAKV